MSKRVLGVTRLWMVVLLLVIAAGATWAKVSTDLVYITNGSGVSVLDVGEKKVTDTFSVGKSPVGIAVLPEGSLAYVVDSVTGLVYAVRTNNYKVEQKIEIGPNGRKIVITLDGRTAYVSKSDGAVKVLDLVKGKVITSTKVGAGPGDMAVSVDNRYVVVANYGSGTVSVIRTSDHGVEKTIAVGKNPSGVAADPNGFFVFVSCRGDNCVCVIDLRTMSMVKCIKGFMAPRGIACTPWGQYAIVANGGAKSLTLIRAKTQTIETKAMLPGAPASLAVTGDNRTVVVNLVDGRTVLLDMKGLKVSDTFKLKGTPMGMALRSKP